jgi:hypothetical protein
MTSKSFSSLKYAIAKRLTPTKRGMGLCGVSALLILGIMAGFSTLPTSASPPPVAQAIPASSVYVTLVAPNGGDSASNLYVLNPNPSPYGPDTNDRTLSTQLPSGSQPVSVQAFRTNPNGSVTQGNQFAWNMTSTGDNYIMSSVSILGLGTYSVYEVVTFADGTQLQSNSINFVFMTSLPSVVTTPSGVTEGPPYAP